MNEIILQYKVDEITMKGNSFVTKDGKFHTEKDKGGFSYWYQTGEPGHLGLYAYDYVFAVPVGRSHALIVLNKLLREYSVKR